MDAMQRWQEREARTDRRYAHKIRLIRDGLMTGHLTQEEHDLATQTLIRRFQVDMAMHYTVYQIAKAAEDMRAEFRL